MSAPISSSMAADGHQLIKSNNLSVKEFETTIKNIKAEIYKEVAEDIEDFELTCSENNFDVPNISELNLKVST